MRRAEVGAIFASRSKSATQLASRFAILRVSPYVSSSTSSCEPVFVTGVGVTPVPPSGVPGYEHLHSHFGHAAGGAEVLLVGLVSHAAPSDAASTNPSTARSLRDESFT